jgi:hypothetical protein
MIDPNWKQSIYSVTSLFTLYRFDLLVNCRNDTPMSDPQLGQVNQAIFEIAMLREPAKVYSTKRMS